MKPSHFSNSNGIPVHAICALSILLSAITIFVISNSSICFAADTGTIVLAQAEIGKKEYVVYVRQVDANGNLTDKTVEVRYIKNERGVIIPPKTTDGKLLDGSKATGDELDIERFNRRILGKYDKEKQVVLAVTGKDDIVQDARKKLSDFVNNLDKASKDGLYNAYYAVTIMSITDDSVQDKEKTNQLISMLDGYASTRLHLNTNDISILRQKARNEALKEWRTVTRSLGGYD